MEGKTKPSIFFLIALLVFLSTTGNYKVEARRPQRLFVFGDSYVDSGNLAKSFNHNINITRSWRFPYGMTYPRNPSGRFSDGRVFTDFFAAYIGIKSPMPYRVRRHGEKRLLFGMNFAHGGSGVFDTSYHQPTLSDQIDMFEEQINRKTFTKCDIASSIALVGISGNDYSYYLSNNGQDLFGFLDVVVGEIEKGSKRLHDLGVRKMALMSMAPLGCTPYVTYNTSHKECDFFDNVGSELHNDRLLDAVDRLNNSTLDSSFFYLDMYNAFDAVIHGKGRRKFKYPLVPCCQAFDNENGNCGDVDKNGVKQYRLCKNPKNSLYWDSVHPTQAGWAAVFDQLHPSLSDLMK